MSTVLSTMANALIEFILSLLRDPDVAAEFDADPDGSLAAAGLGNATYSDVCSVMPLIYDNPQVIQRAEPALSATQTGQPSLTISISPPGVVQELREVMTNNSYVTNNNATMVDQSVNQNIWADGDVMQMFDNDAVIASGADSTAAGDDIVDDRSQDSSTTVVAGRDAAVDNVTDITTVADSHNETVEQPAITPAPAAAAPVTVEEAAPFVESPAATPPAAAPEPEAVADPLSAPEEYADQGVGSTTDTELYDDPTADDDY